MIWNWGVRLESCLMNKRIVIIVLVFILALVGLIIFGPKKVFKEEVEYEVNNIVSNQTGYEYYEDIVHVGLNELCISGEVVMIRLNKGDKEIDGMDLRGAIFTNGLQFLIYMYDLNKREAIEVMAHELIHLDQYRSNRLRETKDSIFFEDKAYKKGNLPAYRDRPWEDEAFRRQSTLQKAIEQVLMEVQ